MNTHELDVQIWSKVQLTKRDSQHLVTQLLKASVKLFFNNGLAIKKLVILN